MGSKAGVTQVAAGRIGCNLDEYSALIAMGQKWCSGCKGWHDRSRFGKDAARADSLAATCLPFKRQQSRQLYTEKPRQFRLFRDFSVAPRDGDKKQARGRSGYGI